MKIFLIILAIIIIWFVCGVIAVVHYIKFSNKHFSSIKFDSSDEFNIFFEFFTGPIGLFAELKTSADIFPEEHKGWHPISDFLNKKFRSEK